MIAPVSSSAEIPRMFLPTPERLSSLSFLQLKSAEVHEMLRSTNGRKELLSRILPHADDIRALHPEFDPSALASQLETVSMIYEEKERFVNSARSPEKAGLFRRAYEAIKRFPRNHPFITAGIVVALLAAGLSYFGYLPKLGEWWEKLKVLFKGRFGIGQDGMGGVGAPSGGTAAGTEAAAGAATEGAIAAGDAIPDSFRGAVEAAKALSAGPNDFIVSGRQILFGGKVYEASDLATLADALKNSGLDKAESIRILRDQSARVTAWQGLQSFLVENGIDAKKIFLHKDLLPSGE